MSSRLASLATDFLKTLGSTDFRFYLLKCVLGASACYGLYLLFPEFQFYWSIVSVLLVLAPDFHDSVKLSVDRIKANFVGALVGLGTFLVRTPDLLSLVISVLATILVCTFVKLGSATRTALAALVIVLIQEKEKNTWELGLERMAAVAAGSLVALVLTVVFHFLLQKVRLNRKPVRDD